mmetsp:Transcript_19179/g.45749  ORF Transcript_19179/g.45749 Transcript_19179/m.45749 type:complete len:252 (-) Transcript_19179:294-1049(-)
MLTKQILLIPPLTPKCQTYGTRNAPSPVNPREHLNAAWKTCSRSAQYQLLCRTGAESSGVCSQVFHEFLGLWLNCVWAPSASTPGSAITSYSHHRSSPLCSSELAAPCGTFPCPTRPRCSVCSRILPSEHLLGLHVSEAHDSFFAAQAARGHKVYCCFVASCAKKFTSSEARRQHLVSAHSFPETFNFNIVCGRRQAKARGRGGAKPGRRLARPDRRQHSLHKGHGEPSGNAERAAVPSSVLRGMEEMSTG